MTSILSESQASRIPGMKKAKRSKMNAERVVFEGQTFDSKAELKRYLELRTLEKQGIISHLERQPQFKLAIDGRPVLIRSARYPNGRQSTYRADFAYFADGKRVIEDVKGMRTKEFILKKAIVEAMHPALRIIEVKA